MCPFGFPTGLSPDRPQETHVVIPQLKSQSAGTSQIKHGKIVPQLVDQVIKLLMQSGTTFKGINQHTVTKQWLNSYYTVMTNISK